MRRTSVGLLVFLAFTPASGQGQTAPRSAHNGVYLELLGNGGLYSINYERQVTRSLGVRAGITSWTTQDNFLGPGKKISVTALPLIVTFYEGLGKNRAELGAGVLVGRKTVTYPGEEIAHNAPFTTLTAVIGYRYQPLADGMIFRIGLTPLIGLNKVDDEAYPSRDPTLSIGLSVGYGF